MTILVWFKERNKYVAKCRDGIDDDDDSGDDDDGDSGDRWCPVIVSD